MLLVCCIYFILYIHFADAFFCHCDIGIRNGKIKKKRRQNAKFNSLSPPPQWHSQPKWNQTSAWITHKDRKQFVIKMMLGCFFVLMQWQNGWQKYNLKFTTNQSQRLKTYSLSTILQSECDRNFAMKWNCIFWLECKTEFLLCFFMVFCEFCCTQNESHKQLFDQILRCFFCWNINTHTQNAETIYLNKSLTYSPLSLPRSFAFYHTHVIIS